MENNIKLFYFFYNKGQKNKALAKVSIIFAKASGKIFFVVYCVIGLYLAVGVKNWSIEGLFLPESKIFLFIFVPLSLLLFNLFLRRRLKAPRPYTVLKIKPLITEKKKYSFPSNHAASACIIAFSCYFVNPVLGIVTLILAFFTGISRVVVGMHFPGDILAGWALGFLFQFLFYIPLKG